MTKRSRIISWILSVASALAIIAWAIGSRIESPADAAARTAPPIPSAILVPIELRELSSNIVTRGKARFGLPQQIILAPSVLKATPGLITSLPLRNKEISEGAVLLTASGRPVFVLQGNVPAYRDLSPATTGEDVRQLEQGLKRLGFDPGRVDGVFDHQTSAAVARWYKSKGWEPYGATKGQLANLSALEREWGEVTKSMLTSDTSASVLTLDSASETAEQSGNVGSVKVTDRNAELEELRIARGRVTLSVEAERAKAEHANKVAAAEFVALTAERALIVLDPRQPETARAAIQAKLEVVRAAETKIKLEGELAVKGAELGARLAADRAAVIGAELGAARSKLGVQIPADEIVFIPKLPVRVQEVSATIGAQAMGPIMSVTNTQLVIDSSLTLETAPLIKPGMQVEIDEQALGIKAKGVVEMIASSPGTLGVDGYHVYFEVRVLETTSNLEGASLRLSIQIKASDGAVIAVPLSALSLAADGTSRIQVQNPEGVVEYVVVTPGLAVEGYVEVKPIKKGTLVQGQMVVVGFNTPENPAAVKNP